MLYQFGMRIFLHLKGFNLSKISSHQQLRILQKSQNKTSKFIIIFSVKSIASTDQLISIVANRLDIPSQDLQLKLIIKHQNQYHRIVIVKGFSFALYVGMLGDGYSWLKYQLQLQVLYTGQKIIENNLDETGDQSNSGLSEAFSNQQSLISHEIYHYSNQLFQYLKIDQVGLFVNLLSVFLKKHNTSQFGALLNLYQRQTGYTLLLASIFYNKYQFCQSLVKGYGKYIDFNLKSIDGWLPFQLALASQNPKAIDLLIQQSHYINLDLNFHSEHGQIIFNLINTINIDLIEKVVKTFAIRFQDHHQEQQNNVYDFVWNHHRLTQSQKKNMLQLMHRRHLQLFDFYREDQILYNSCKKYLPEAPRRHSPKKQIIYNPNLKIVSGQIIKCKNPAIFSKYVYLSVNSYAGAVEQYEINTKLKTSNDKDKLQRYLKKHHLSFQEIQSVQLIDQKDKSWFLKKQWHCFSIKSKRNNKTVFACNHEYTANIWINQIKQAIQAWVKNEYKHYNNKVVKNYVHISDVQYKPPTHITKKTGSKKLFELFSNRLSLCEPQPVHHEPSLQKQMPMVKSKSHYNTMNEIPSEPILQSLTSLKFKDFRMMKLLGQGSFGQVFLVQCLKNKKLYALKAFKKKKIILSKQTKFVISQVNILKQIKHPFIIKLYFTFQTPNYIYLGLQYCEGKDLSRHMNQEMMFPEDQVKIYAAQIVLAIQYLHSIGIIYRDLKPQNIMLGKDGHVFLVDFGLSKKTQNNFAKTFCGSPAYLSPQMIDKQGVGPQSDFFTLGVVIYEFIFGEPPFFSDNIHLLYDTIQNGKIKYPRKIDQATKNLLQGLLNKDPKLRLGSRSIGDIKSHPYFKQINWQKLYRKQIKAPIRQLHDPDFEAEQQSQEVINIFHDDFDYSEENYKINRFKNFSFFREQEFC